jgi:hypothetical protein
MAISIERRDIPETRIDDGEHVHKRCPPTKPRYMNENHSHFATNEETLA